MLQPGTLLHYERYEIRVIVKSGGMGAIYRAYDRRLGIEVAVKENLDSSAQNRFVREAQVLARLRHPNLPRVSDYFVDEQGVQYLVMDFIEGMDIADYVVVRQQRKPIPADLALPWLRQVSEAVAYLHEQQPAIIHRDIKPQNIIITPQGRAVLVDFGIARTGINLPDAAASSTIRLTPGFAPIEQYTGRESVGPFSDVYALGATAYFMLTARMPPEAVDRVAAMMSGSPDPLQPVREINPEVSQALADTIMQAAAIQPPQRFPDGAALRAALELDAFTGPTQVMVNPAGATPALQQAAYGTGAAPITGPAGGSPPGGQAETATTRTARQAPPTQHPAWQSPFALLGALVVIVLGVVGALFGTGVIGGQRAVEPPTTNPLVVAQATSVPTGTPTPAPTDTPDPALLTPTTDPIVAARGTVAAVDTATAAALAATATREAELEQTVLARILANTAAAQTAAEAATQTVIALTPTATVTNTPLPTNTRPPFSPTPRPTLTPAATAVPTRPPFTFEGGQGERFSGRAYVGQLPDPAAGQGGSCIQGSVRNRDGGAFEHIFVQVSRGSETRQTRSFDFVNFSICGLPAGYWGVAVYEVNRTQLGGETGAHQVRFQLTGTPGEIVYVEFKER